MTKSCAQGLNKSLALWTILSSQICNKLLPIQSSSSTLATVTISTSFELVSSHARVTSIKFTKQEWVSQSVRESVTDKHSQWSDSGPIKRNRHQRIREEVQQMSRSSYLPTCMITSWWVTAKGLGFEVLLFSTFMCWVGSDGSQYIDIPGSSPSLPGSTKLLLNSGENTWGHPGFRNILHFTVLGSWSKILLNYGFFCFLEYFPYILWNAQR